jgi:hypothetical protein
MLNFVAIKFIFSFFLEKKRNKKFKKRSSTAAPAGHTSATLSGSRASRSLVCALTAHRITTAIKI